MGLSPGYRVSNHVRLVRELKRGGMGSVWIADHIALQTQVAVKFMAGVAADDAAAMARFTREATSAAQIKSPHVVQIHDHGVTSDGRPFMVMELLHGEDLSTRIKRDGPISLDAAVQIVSQVCRVLARAHQLGIVHRDIKPSNLFLLDEGGEVFVKVLDFGVAKLGEGESELTTTGVLVGTLVYMSPEQLLSAKTVDHRADLWSLAVAAYQAITAELPYKHDDGLGALCRAVEQGAFVRPSVYDSSVPPGVDAWFERAFDPKVEARFDSAKEMMDTLHRAVGKSPPRSSSASLQVRSEARHVQVHATSAPTRSGSLAQARAAMLADDARGAGTRSLPDATISDGAIARGHLTSTGAVDAMPPKSERPDSVVSPPHTLAGTASVRPQAKKHRRGRRSLLGIFGVTAALSAAAGVIVFAKWPAIVSFHRGSDAPTTKASQPSTNAAPADPTPSAAVPSTRANAANVGDAGIAAPRGSGEPVVTMGPQATSAVPSAMAVPTGPRAAPNPGPAEPGSAPMGPRAVPNPAEPSPKGPRNGGPGPRAGQPEKDYGF